VADSVPLNSLVFSASNRAGEDLHEDKGRHNGSKPEEHPAKVLLGVVLASFWLTIAHDDIQCLLLQVVQLVNFVAKHDEFEDDVDQKCNLADYTKELQFCDFKNFTRVERLLRQSCVVDGLDEKEGKRVEEEVKDESTANLAREVFEIEQAVRACEVGEWDDGVEQKAESCMLLLLHVHTFQLVVNFILGRAQTIVLLVADLLTNVLSCN